MINNIIAGAGISVSSPYRQHVSVTGSVRWNGALHILEVMDQANWLPLYNSYDTTTVTMSQEYINAIEWARKKMLEEEKILALCEQHPGLKDLKEKYELMLVLTRATF